MTVYFVLCKVIKLKKKKKVELMLSAFVLIKLMKIKQSLALSARCNSFISPTAMLGVTHTHTEFRNGTRHP